MDDAGKQKKLYSVFYVVNLWICWRTNCQWPKQI